MKFLQELVRFNRLDDDQEDDMSDDDLLGDESNENDGEFDDFDDYMVGDEPDEDEFSDDDMLDGETGEGESDEGEFDDMDLPNDEPDESEFDDGDMGDMEEGEPEEPEDPDRAGLIRTVNKAHLVYKRSTDDGSYEEMWTYNVTNLRDEMSIRKAILSGTDIPPNKTQSPDGSQHYELWTAGNAEVMLIKGLPQ